MQAGCALIVLTNFLKTCLRLLPGRNCIAVGQTFKDSNDRFQEDSIHQSLHQSLTATWTSLILMAQPATSMAAARNRPKPSWLVGLLASVLLAAATFLPAQGASLLNKLTLKQPAGCTPQQVSNGGDTHPPHNSIYCLVGLP
jgi:hypothetical protein